MAARILHNLLQVGVVLGFAPRVEGVTSRLKENLRCTCSFRASGGVWDGQYLVGLGAVDRAGADASAMQAWVAVSVALLEIIIGAVAGNLFDLTLTPWVNYLAGFGAILLTFLAGAEIDVKVIRRNFGSTMAIGIVGFLAPYLGVLGWAHFISG